MMDKRPLLLYLMLLALAVLALSNVLLVIQTIRSWNWLLVFGYIPSPIYKVFEGTFFTLLFIAGGISLWARSPIAPMLNGVSLAVYLIWSWVDRLLITVNPAPLSSHLLAAGISLFLFLLAEFSLFLLTPYMHRPTHEADKEDEDGRSESGS